MKQGTKPKAVAVPITISTGINGPKVHPDSVEITTEQEVNWETDPVGKEFVVCFAKDKPFQHRYFHDSRKKSGKPNVPADPAKKYKYCVEVDGVRIDPDIIVKG